MTTGIKTMQCAQAAGTMAYRFGKDAAHALRTLVQFDPYRPDLHYMRGPGPKWHAQNGHAFASLNVPAAQRPPTNLGAARPVDS